MYLSRVELDPFRRSTMTALVSPQKIHGAVECSFPGERNRRLWRIDALGEKLYLLIVSEEVPDLTNLCSQFGTGAMPETRNYEPLLQRIEMGSVWQFRLTANPTRSRKTENDLKGRGKITACGTVQEQEKWLLDHAERNGFVLMNDSVTVKKIREYRFHKKETSAKTEVTLLAVTYEGVLRVTEPEKFRQILCNGIGRGKAYGLGLMTVMRWR